MLLSKRAPVPAIRKINGAARRVGNVQDQRSLQRRGMHGAVPGEPQRFTQLFVLVRRGDHRVFCGNVLVVGRFQKSIIDGVAPRDTLHAPGQRVLAARLHQRTAGFPHRHLGDFRLKDQYSLELRPVAQGGQIAVGSQMYVSDERFEHDGTIEE